MHPDSPPLVKRGTDRWEFEYEGLARRLSYIECSALQGFPNPLAFDIGHVRDRFRVIGNAVPPPLFAAVSRQLAHQLETRE